MKGFLFLFCPLLLVWTACQGPAQSQPVESDPPVEQTRAIEQAPDLSVHCTAANAELCQSHLEGLKAANLGDLPIQEVAVTVGKRFMGTPYVAKTLEIEGEEQLVVDMQGLDCTTFLENVVVMSRLVKQDRLTLEDFHQELAHLRYREGQLDGYPSRLHYFSEWIHDNGQKGIIKDITQEIGGEVFDKTIDFMSTHRDAYTQLVDDNYYAGIQAMEASLNQTFPRYYIPQDQVAAHESKIQSGDLIAITTGIKGLDISHVGFAIEQDGRMHLFHASTGAKEVVISEKPLADYLAGIKRHSGIMVCRLL